MAVFARLFKSSKCQRIIETKLQNSDQRKSWENTDFTPDQIRLILFKDHDIQGRKLIFDSKAIKKIDGIKEEPAKKSKSKVNEEFNLSSSNDQLRGDSSPRYQITRAGSDVKLLGEMMFGSAPITHQGTTLRVHSIRAPSQLMVTKVFIPNRTNRESSGYGDESYDNASLNSSLNDISSSQSIANTSSGYSSSVAHSIPVDVPFSSHKNKDEDSGLSVSASSQTSGSFHTPYHSPGSSSSINSNSFNSLHRRFVRSQTMTLQYGIRKRASCEGVDGQPTTPCQRRSKIGLGIVFEVSEGSASDWPEHFQSFFFSHITLIEGHINKLILAVEQACCARKNFVNNVMENLEIFRGCIADLVLAKRLPQPVWLDMMAYSTHRYGLCAKYMKEFMLSVEKCDTKNTNFFLSTLITAVLTYHLAWVPTVTPAGASQSRAYHDKHTAKWLDALAKSHPYNPLWAQLGDMYGALGSPLRLARTVVFGQHKDVVHKILYILSYFIRCSEIHENTDEQVNLDEIHNTSLHCEQCGATPRGMSFPEAVHVLEHGQKADRFLDSDSEFLSSNATSESESVVFDWRSTSLSGQNFYTSDSGFDSDDLCHSIDDSDYKHCVGKSCFYLPKPENYTHLKDSSAYSSKVDVSNTQKEEKTKGQILKENTWENHGCMSTSLYPKIEIDKVQSLYPILDSNLTVTTSPHLLAHSDQTVPSIYPNLDILERTTECVDNLKTDLSSATKCVGDTSVKTLSGISSHSTDSIDDKLVFKEVECKVSPHEISAPRVECVRNVGRSAIESTVKCDHIGGYDTPFESPSENKAVSVSRSPTKVTTQLQNGRTYFRWPSREGSNSMFDEYFDGDSEINTIDDPPCVSSQTSAASSVSETNQLELYRSVSNGSVTPTPSALERSVTGCNQCDHEREDLSFDKRKVDLLLKVAVQPSSTQEILGTIQPPRCPEEELDLPSSNLPFRYFRSINDRNELSPVAESPHAPVTRQESSASTRTVTPGVCRCRSVTPTSRSRHASACSTDTEPDEFVNLVDLPLPRSKYSHEEGGDIALSSQQSFGRSLLADFSNHYLSDFVLHGTSDEMSSKKLSNDLNLAVQNTVLDEEVGEAVGILADTDKWEVHLLSSLRTSSNGIGKVVTASQLVTSMIESVTNLWHMKMSPEFCLMHLEDRLQEMYFKSRMLAEYIKSQKKVDMDELTAMLGFEASDLHLLFSIAGTHSPHLAFGIY